MDLVSNIKKMYELGHGHVLLLAASIRSLNHVLGAFALQSDLVTAPAKLWEEWASASFPLPGQDFVYEGIDKNGARLKSIPYRPIDLNGGWESFDIRHELTNKGIRQFVADYQNTLKQSA
jgi:transaldolase